jgi:CubicO group peptidase (beta-lactamase class C family)
LGIVLGFIGMVLVPPACSPVAAQPTGDRLTEIREVVRDRGKERKTHTGIVVGVVDAEGRRTFGYGQPQDGGSRVDSSTIFEIGSLTKVFTGLLLAGAVEQDVASLDTPVEKTLPITVNTPAQSGKEITFRHLVTHTSGLPRLPANFSLENRDDPYANYTIKNLYHAANKEELQSVPGTEREYSNLGYGLLGHALARVQEADYASLVRSRIADPLDMSKTRIAVSSADSSAMATGHDPVGRPVPYWSFTEAFAGTGALHSSANDLLTFLEAQLGLRTVPDRLAEAIDRSHTVLHEGEEDDIAYGWHVRSVNGRQTYWHSGRTGGFTSFMAFDPERKIGVVVLSNSARSVDDLGFRVLNQKAELESVYNPHRRFAIEAGIVNDVTSGTRGHVGASFSYLLDRHGRLLLRPYAEYSRFRISGRLDSGVSPRTFTFDTGTVGVALESRHGLLSLPLRWLDLPGKIYASLAEIRLNFALQMRRQGVDVASRTSRWSYQFGNTLRYRKGAFYVSITALRDLHFFGEGKHVEHVGAEELSTLSIGYRF